MSRRRFKILLTATLWLTTQNFCLAEPVYKFEDPNSGVPFYSTGKTNNKFKEAELPEINRAEMQLMPVSKKTCNGHNGIDCSLGGDIDGSVICRDLYRDSVERFAFMCRYASLTVNGIGKKSKTKTIPVYIRNSKPVSAMKPVVKYKSDLGYTANLAGPDEILPYAIGEFELLAQDAIIVGSKLDETRFIISCDNCDNSSTPAAELPGQEEKKKSGEK